MSGDKEVRMGITIGKTILLGSHWFQLIPGEDAIIEIEPSNARLIVRLADFNMPGEPEPKMELVNETDLILTLFRIGKSQGFGTTKPTLLGTLGSLRLTGSFLVTPFEDSVQIDLALYGELLEEEEIDGQD